MFVVFHDIRKVTEYCVLGMLSLSQMINMWSEAFPVTANYADILLMTQTAYVIDERQ